VNKNILVAAVRLDESAMDKPRPIAVSQKSMPRHARRIDAATQIIEDRGVQIASARRDRDHCDHQNQITRHYVDFGPIGVDSPARSRLLRCFSGG
jgi:hypothetical protein